MRWQSTARLIRAFKKVASGIAKKYGKKAAGAILASATRKAKRGPAGKKNKRLKRVKG